MPATAETPNTYIFMLLPDYLFLAYQRCHRRAFLDTYGDAQQKAPLNDFVLKLMRENRAFQKTVLAGQNYEQPSYPSQDWQSGFNQTLSLMQQGVEQIHRGVLAVSTDIPAPDALETYPVILISYPDLLIKKPGQSAWGDWYYTPLDIRLGKRPKQEYQMIMAFHGMILGEIQERVPEGAGLMLRKKGLFTVNLTYRIPQMQAILSECVEMLHRRREPEVFISRQKCSLCSWYPSCYSVAQSQNHLSLVPGITPGRYQRLQELGVINLAALAQTPMEDLTIHPEFPVEIAAQVIQQAQSSVQKQPLPRSFLTPTPTPLAWHHPGFKFTPTPIELYFDIEAEPELNLDYLHGVLVVDKQNHTEQFYSFLAESPAEEFRAWKQLLELMWMYPIAPIYHFCDYEVQAMKRLARLYQTPDYLWKPLLKRFIDIHLKVTQTVTLPIESYSLKHIARWLGFQWRDSNANGAQCVCWYEEWLTTENYNLLEAIVRYNEDDCQATYQVKTWLTDFLDESQR